MARKKETLAPEEKLAQALVPKDQQPYELPKGWVWTRLGFLASNQYGFTEKAIINNIYPKFLRITDIQNGEIDWENVPNCKINKEDFEKYCLASGDILIARTGATTGKSCYISDPPKSVFASFLIRLKVANPDMVYFVYDFLQSDLYWKQISELSSGIAQPGVNSRKLTNIVFPLPPLPEQQRIVARIESLFAKLDEAREKLQQVLDTQEARRAAILHEAFTGRLTGHGSEERRGKREEDSLSHLDEVEFVPEGWRKVKLSDVCTVNPPKIKTKGLDDSLEVSFYPMASVDEHTGTVTKPEKRTLGEVKRGYTNFIENDVVLAKITPCFENGKSAIIGPLLNHIGYGTTEFFVLRSAKDLYNKFLFYLVRSSKFRSEAKDHMTGAVGQQRVPKDFVEDYSFFLPPLEEQILIVDILDSLLDKEYRSFEIAQRLVSQIELLKKSILARAFRGELGTQDPSDPDARELLLEQ